MLIRGYDTAGAHGHDGGAVAPFHGSNIAFRKKRHRSQRGSLTRESGSHHNNQSIPNNATQITSYICLGNIPAFLSPVRPPRLPFCAHMRASYICNHHTKSIHTQNHIHSFSSLGCARAHTYCNAKTNFGRNISPFYRQKSVTERRSSWSHACPGRTK